MKMAWMTAITIAAGLCYGGACCLPTGSAVLSAPVASSVSGDAARPG